MANSPLIAELRQTHDVNVARFDQEVEPVVYAAEESGWSRVEGRGSRAEKRMHATSLRPSTLDPRPSTPSTGPPNLQPRGTQTRLGQALADELRLYRDAPLAGVIVISDGAQNAGIEPGAAIEAAHQAKVPLFTVGVGSAAAQRNIAIRDLVVPTRAFPERYAQRHRLSAGQRLRRPDGRCRAHCAAAPKTPPAAARPSPPSASPLGPDGEMAPVSFDIEPGEPGTFVFQLRVKAPPDDGNPRDNEREAEIEIVDRKTRVLLFASGPMRDYQFLRNQLHRDATMITDVYLQTAQPGISQDAEQNSRSLPQHARGAVPIRLHRGVRSRLDEARCGPGRPRREVGFRGSRRPDRGRGAD